MNTLTVGGCIRFPPGGSPHLYENAVHKSGVITYVGISGGSLEIKHTRPPGASISAVIASPDETLAARGIILGASGGLDRTLVRFYSTRAGATLDLSDARDYAAIAGDYSNAWIAWTYLLPDRD